MTGATGPTAVLKFGGEVVLDRAQLDHVLEVVADLTARGWRFVLCHGGGPQVTALTRRLGAEPNMVGGRRVTDLPTLQIAKQVLTGEVNVDVVAAALAAGLEAVGIAGVSARTVHARRRPARIVSGGGPDPVDFGWVGEIIEIRTHLVHHLWEGGYTPVLSTLGVGDVDGDVVSPVYNINADTVASAVAKALDADHLFLMTAIGGVLRDRDDPSTRIPRLDAASAHAAIAAGVINGGMIPKVEEALVQLRHEPGGPGVGAVHILGADGDILRAEAALPGSRGTVLVP
ncbi:MAG: acetylglutamate kinase [Deltaproteobacteria bacterium]|nr:MAG: acetylglutamate kinase [Deltaproteobacteria bacterium]